MKAPAPQTALLWLALVVCAPVPFFLVEVGHQPVAATAQIFAVILELMATEGTNGAITLAAWILGVQIIVGLIVLAVVASIVTAALRRTLGERGNIANFALVIVMLVVALTQPIYRTPFRTAGLQATLVQVFE